MHRHALAILALVALGAAHAARANCCVFPDPLLGIHETAGREGGGRLSLVLEGRKLGYDLPAGGGRRAIEVVTARLAVVHSPVERWVLLAEVPWSVEAVRGGGPGQPSGAAHGLGDASVGVRYALFRQVEFLPDPEVFAVTRAQALALGIGARLPTGATTARAGGGPVEPRAQPGSGAVAAEVGLRYRRAHGRWDVLATVSGVFEGGGAGGYRRGDAVRGTVEAERLTFDGVALGLALTGAQLGRDRQGGVAVPATGGLLLTAAPLLDVDLGRGFWLRLRAEVPAMRTLDGAQRQGPGFGIELHREVAP
jgi:hypothetical protein